MLNVDTLKSQIKESIENIVIPAVKEIELERQPTKSDIGDKMAEDLSKMFSNLVSEPLAESLANAIDYYVKNIAISGIIITTGGPTTQMAKISATPTPIVNGKVPNTLGIS